jgi:hypothetical protein
MFGVVFLAAHCLLTVLKFAFVLCRSIFSRCGSADRVLMLLGFRTADIQRKDREVQDHRASTPVVVCIHSFGHVSNECSTVVIYVV